MSRGLVLSETIIGVHDDLSEWAIIGAGFDDDKNFVIEMSYSDIDNDISRRWDKRIIIDIKDIDPLLHRMNTTLLKLPCAFQKRYGVEGDVWMVSEVIETFNAMLDYIKQLKVRYRIEKEDRSKNYD